MGEKSGKNKENGKELGKRHKIMREDGGEE